MHLFHKWKETHLGDGIIQMGNALGHSHYSQVSVHLRECKCGKERAYGMTISGSKFRMNPVIAKEMKTRGVLDQ